MKKKYKVLLFAVLFLVSLQISNIIITLILSKTDFISHNLEVYIIYYCLPISTLLIGTAIVIKVYKFKLNLGVKILSHEEITVLFFVNICFFLFSLLYDFLLNIGSENLFFIKPKIPELEWNNFITVFIVLIIGPVVEEILYRRIIFVKLKKHYSLLVSVLISSILFSVFHMDINNLVPAFMAGIFFAYVYHITKSLLIVIICHSLINLMVIFSTTTKVDFEPIVFVLYLTMFMMAFIGLILGFKKLQKLYNVKNELE